MSNPKMDVYSVMMVPFQVGAYCRSHRYSVEAVALARALKEKDAAETLIAQAQKQADAAEAKVVASVKAVEEKMRREGEL